MVRSPPVNRSDDLAADIGSMSDLHFSVFCQYELHLLVVCGVWRAARVNKSGCHLHLFVFWVENLSFSPTLPRLTTLIFCIANPARGLPRGKVAIVKELGVYEHGVECWVGKVGKAKIVEQTTEKLVLKVPNLTFFIRDVNTTKNFFRLSRIEITGSKSLPVRVGYSSECSTAYSKSIQHRDDLPAENLSNPYQKEKHCCVLCKYGVEVDYKNARLLSQFLSPFTGKVYERNITGLCKAKQRSVEREIVKSQNAGYLAVMLKKVEYIRDPKLCDPNRPVRPHRY